VQGKAILQISRWAIRHALLLGALLAALLAFSPIVVSRALTRTSADAVAEGLTCQCGCGLTVANCNHPQCEFSVPVRTQIEAMIAKGMNSRQIVTSFRVKYGEKILSAPTTDGFNLLAWIMPFGAILLGGGVIFALFARWRSGSKTRPVPAAAEARFDPELRERLESALKEDR
jgi:cytochrome c-type biogenesis protein CcmH